LGPHTKVWKRSGNTKTPALRAPAFDSPQIRNPQDLLFFGV